MGARVAGLGHPTRVFFFAKPPAEVFPIKLFLKVLLLFTLLASPAQADWRWAPHPHYPKLHPHAFCDTPQCVKAAWTHARAHRRLRIANYNAHKRYEWNHWTRLYIPTCTWFGESGRGPQYARYRYTMPNEGGSGAFGKFQFKSQTYHSVAKYHDWSPLDQEIAGRREYWLNGTSPWSNC